MMRMIFTATSSQTLCAGKSWHMGVRNPGPPGQEIRWLESETGQVFLTPELAWQMERHMSLLILLYAVPVGLFMLLSVWLGIAIARHPQRYKPWLRRLYYRDEAFVREVQKNLPR